MKRTLLFSILAMVPAALLPLAATSQVSPAQGSSSTDQAEPPSYKYEAFAGYAYTSLNQVNGSRSGLQGVQLSITRDWGKYFGLMAEEAYYKFAITTPVVESTTIAPSVDSVLAGPVFHANIFGKYSGFVRAMIGGEHTGGTGQTPNISFAGGFGGGMEYALTPRISLRASGDRIGSSFSVINNSSTLDYSPHRTWSPRASFGAVYHF